jgi:hypothetical protein
MLKLRPSNFSVFMLKNRIASARDLLAVSNQPGTAKDFEEFTGTLRASILAIRDQFLEPVSARHMESFVSEAFEQSNGLIKQRRLLELCLWPMYERVTLAPAAGEQAEVLWMFCVPVVVQFSQKATTQPNFISPTCLDGHNILKTLSDSGCLNPNAALSMFPTLLSREDLHLYGPQKMASMMLAGHFSTSDAGLETPVPLPLLFDEESESGRVVTLFMVVIARLPEDESSLATPRAVWPAEKIERQVWSDLVEQHLDVERVESYPLVKVTQALFRCSPEGHGEVRTMLQLAVLHNGITGVYTRFPMDGMAEIYGMGADGEPIFICPPIAVLEPAVAFSQLVKESCLELDLPYLGLQVVHNVSALH